MPHNLPTQPHTDRQHKIRLYGIDAPEGGQDFGNRAKKFVSDLVFGKQVRVVKMDIDRYDRVVGMVYVGDVNANEALVKKKGGIYAIKMPIPPVT